MNLNKILPFLAVVAMHASGWSARAADAYGFDFGCAALEGEAFMRAVVDSGEKRAHCLAGAGLLKEARGALGPSTGYRNEPLYNALQILLTRDDETYEALLPVARAGSVQAAFLLLAASEDNPSPALSAPVRRSAVAYFETTPQWMKNRVALRIADRLLAAGDHHAALRLAEAVKEDPAGGAEALEAARDEARGLNLSRFIKARVLESRGAWREAAALYDAVEAPWDDALTVEAKLRRIALLWRTGAEKTETAVAKLETLNMEWRGGALGAKVRLALARAYAFNERYYEAILALAPVLDSTAPAPYRREAQARLGAVATTFVVSHATEDDALAVADIYARFRTVIAPDAHWSGDRAAALILTQAGMPALAGAMLRNSEPEAVRADGGARALVDYAKVFVAAGDAQRAETFLAAAAKANEAKADKGGTDEGGAERDAALAASIERLRIDIAPARALADWRGRDLSPAADRRLAARAWSAGAWDVYRAAAENADGAPGRLLGRDERAAIAAYLADAERPPAHHTSRRTGRAADKGGVHPDDALSRALAVHEEETLFAAADLKNLLKPADAALGLDDLLTAQLASLDDDAASQPDAGEGTDAAGAPPPAIN